MTKPTMAPYRRHILVCTGQYCAPKGAGKQIYQQLPHLLSKCGLLFGPDRVKRGETPCLGVCQNGPIVAIYPDGLWYHGVTPQVLERIVYEHLLRNHPVDDYLFHDLFHQDDELGDEQIS